MNHEQYAMNHRIWIYWEDRQGHSEPPHITLCRRIFFEKCQDCSVTLVTPANLLEYLPGIPERINRVMLQTDPTQPCLALKCDFIRAFLLERYGGLYVDSDAVLLRSLKPALQMLSDWDFVGMRRTSAPSQHISVGFYGSKAKGKIITKYADSLRNKLESGKLSFGWADVGAWTLTPIVNENSESAYLFPEAHLHPIVCERQEDFLSTTLRLESFLTSDPLMFMLFHRLFDGPLRETSIQNLYFGDMLISQIFRYALPQEQFMKWISTMRPYDRLEQKH